MTGAVYNTASTQTLLQEFNSLGTSVTLSWRTQPGVLSCGWKRRMFLPTRRHVIFVEMLAPGFCPYRMTSRNRFPPTRHLPISDYGNTRGVVAPSAIAFLAQVPPVWQRLMVTHEPSSSSWEPLGDARIFLQSFVLSARLAFKLN